LGTRGGAMQEPSAGWTRVPGTSTRLRHLDHTADVALEVRAPFLEDLLAGAVEGMTGLILGDARPEGLERRVVEVEGDDPARLLRNLLREALYLHEAEGFAVASTRIRLRGSREPAGNGPLGPGPSSLSLEAELLGGPDPAPPDRELKGVTLHGLEAAERDDGEWFARVIFDV
jgi:SHS2 domain-containing protein